MKRSLLYNVFLTSFQIFFCNLKMTVNLKLVNQFFTLTSKWTYGLLEPE